ncbi:uncharacterized protein VNE69_12143 [Vairimorpha necatrix]|uniref:Uncharacterized protein n=1 Tax=Vairimorpha necatrix TaxID=6039 RepID=A0AAX4JI91_9MICR
MLENCGQLSINIQNLALELLRYEILKWLKKLESLDRIEYVLCNASYEIIEWHSTFMEQTRTLLNEFKEEEIEVVDVYRLFQKRIRTQSNLSNKSEVVKIDSEEIWIRYPTSPVKKTLII